MVLASNEWLTNCEDEQKSAAGDNSTATTAAATNTATTTTNTLNEATTAVTSTSAAAAAGAIITATLALGATAAAAANSTSSTTITNSSVTSIPNAAATAAAIATTTATIPAAQITVFNPDITTTAAATPSDSDNNLTANLSIPDKEEKWFLINALNLIKIMAENTNDELVIKSELLDDANATTTITAPGATVATATTGTYTNLTDSESESENNNSEPLTAAALLSAAIGENSNFNAHGNSNTNTLLASTLLARQTKSTPISSTPLLPLSSPITPQALSSALQTAMNAANNANNAVAAASTAAGNLQNNFLNSLGIGIAASGANASVVPQQQQQQQTAKLHNVAFYALDKQPSNLNINASQSSSSSVSSNAFDSSENDGGQAKIILICDANSHPFQTRTIYLTPNIECKVGRLIAKSKACESNAIFDCKVLSRNHAVLWYTDDGKFWVKDTKSSNGTFINENKLGNEAAELHFGDIVKFGVDVLENSRKEVHGCIIAVVKLYLPDGRESISIDDSPHRSQYSGEGRISFDELHRLNLYMQEASQREKVLKSKLFNIQNVLDATRKNSTLCWQSLIAEDQLLHRIHSLEKKIQIMEKNVPESTLRNEVLKLLEDKNSYQHTAKEALRKVYQERCDAMQMLSKMESAYMTSDNECKILRDQIMNTKQSLQDVNARLLHLEAEYNEYKEETARQEQEAKEKEEQRIGELTEALQQREHECAELKRKISELLVKRAELLDDEEQLEKQAIEEFDAAIADMDLGDDEDDEIEDADDEVNDVVERMVAEDGDNENTEKPESILLRSVGGCSPKATGEIHKISSSALDVGDSVHTKSLPKTNERKTKKFGKQKVVKESTIMKWLQNSDLNKKEGSLDIFKAICNESDSSDENDVITSTSATGAGAKANSKTQLDAEEFEKKCTNFAIKLESAQNVLKQLEAEIANETKIAQVAVAVTDDGSVASDNESGDDDDNDDKDDNDADDAFIIKRNGKLNNLLPKDNRSYGLLKSSITILRDAYNEICEIMTQQQKSLAQQCPLEAEEATAQKDTNAKSSPPPAISVQTQFQNYAQHKQSNSAVKKLEAQETLKPLNEASNEEEDEDENDSDDDDISDATRLSVSSVLTIREVDEAQKSAKEKQIETEIHEYQHQITEMKDRLVQIESDSQHTLEIMQLECDALRDKEAERGALINKLQEEKDALEKLIEQQAFVADQQATTTTTPTTKTKTTTEEKTTAPNAENVTNTTTTTPALSHDDSDSSAFEQQMREELAAINNTAMQREEELIMYKERLEEFQLDNVKLRNEIGDLQHNANMHIQKLLARMVPFGLAVVAFLIYFLMTYF